MFTLIIFLYKFNAFIGVFVKIIIFIRTFSNFLSFLQYCFMDFLLLNQSYKYVIWSELDTQCIQIFAPFLFKHHDQSLLYLSNHFSILVFSRFKLLELFAFLQLDLVLYWILYFSVLLKELREKYSQLFHLIDFKWLIFVRWRNLSVFAVISSSFEDRVNITLNWMLGLWLVDVVRELCYWINNEELNDRDYDAYYVKIKATAQNNDPPLKHLSPFNDE